MAGLEFDASSKAYAPLLILIEQKLRADQGNRYRQELEKVIMEQRDVYEQKKIQFRSHMGASLLGKKCKRDIWYSFRWVKEPNFDGRMIRLFNRGHLEETRFIAILRQAGLDVWFKHSDGSQFAFSNCNGHYGGSLDSVVKGVPGYENIPMLGEYKTHSEKSFTKLVQLGVKSSKPEHWTQMNQYMGHYKLTHALYLAVNKNNDELYAEIVEFDEEEFKFDVTLALTISHSNRLPAKINNSPSFWLCKYCDFMDICHKKAPVKKTCRTCNYVTMQEGGVWSCSIQNGLVLDKEMQYNGCGKYIKLEEL